MTHLLPRCLADPLTESRRAVAPRSQFPTAGTGFPRHVLPADKIVLNFQLLQRAGNGVEKPPLLRPAEVKLFYQVPAPL